MPLVCNVKDAGEVEKERAYAQTGSMLISLIHYRAQASAAACQTLDVLL